MNKLVIKDPAKEGLLGFAWIADQLMQISNPNDSPKAWKIQSAALPESNKTALIGTACYVDGDYAYFLPPCQNSSKTLTFIPQGSAEYRKGPVDLSNVWVRILERLWLEP